MAKRSAVKLGSKLAINASAAVLHLFPERFLRLTISTETSPMTHGGICWRYAKSATYRFRAELILSSLIFWNTRTGSSLTSLDFMPRNTRVLTSIAVRQCRE